MRDSRFAIGELANFGLSSVFIHDLDAPPGTAAQATLNSFDSGFASDLAWDGADLIVGVDAIDSGRGELQVFSPVGPSYQLVAHLAPPLLAPGDRFGTRVSVIGEELFVWAATGDGLQADTGALHVFERSGGSWIYRQQIAGSLGGYRDLFGLSVALVGDTLAVGAPSLDLANGDDGAVFLFRRGAGGNWVESDMLADPGTNLEWFGFRVAEVSGKLVVARPITDPISTTPNRGELRVYNVAPSGASLVQSVFGLDGNSIGFTMASDGETLFVGSPTASPTALICFRWANGALRETHRVEKSFPIFPGRIDADRGRVGVGSFAYDLSTPCGAAFVYDTYSSVNAPEPGSGPTSQAELRLACVARKPSAEIVLRAASPASMGAVFYSAGSPPGQVLACLKLHVSSLANLSHIFVTDAGGSYVGALSAPVSAHGHRFALQALYLDPSAACGLGSSNPLFLTL